MKVKRIFLLGLFVVLAANAWTLDLRAIAYRAFMYLGSPVPEKATLDGNFGRIVDNKQGDYIENWALALGTNKEIKAAYYYVFDSNRNKLNIILSDFETQVYIQGYKFLFADESCTAYVTNDGPFSIAIMIGNSIMTNKQGNTYIMIAFKRLADML